MICLTTEIYECPLTQHVSSPPELETCFTFIKLYLNRSHAQKKHHKPFQPIYLYCLFSSFVVLKPIFDTLNASTQASCEYMFVKFAPTSLLINT